MPSSAWLFSQRAVSFLVAWVVLLHNHRQNVLSHIVSRLLSLALSFPCYLILWLGCPVLSTWIFKVLQSLHHFLKHSCDVTISETFPQHQYGCSLLHSQIYRGYAPSLLDSPWLLWEYDRFQLQHYCHSFFFCRLCLIAKSIIFEDQ